MIHEALFALWNYPDDLFKTVTEEEWLNSVELQEFLHPGEQDNQLVIQNNIRPGLYIKAFCDGLDNVLQSYKNAVVDIENTFLKNPSLTLAYILGEIQKFDTLLEVLSKMIRMIETENIHGVLLMSRLYLYTNCGIPLVVDAANRIVWIVRNDPKKTEDVSYQLKYRRDIWNGKDVEYYQKIQRLENYPFNLANFDKTIEECRLRITQYLWTIMVNEAKILKHLQHVRDYYALGRGELFQQFILTAGNHLKEAPNNYILKNLNLIFTETATKMYGENDKSYQKFELALIKTSEANTNPWTSLKLNFDIVWPLHIIFHPKALELYNKLFQFLLTITRTQIELNKLWQLHMSYKNKIDRRVWTLRHSLVYLVNNLQYYLQVDVIEAEFSVLKEAVKNANEFEDIIRLHSKFMSKLLSKTFVMCVDETTHHDHNHSLYQVPSLNFNTKNTIYNIILLLLEVCNEFCLIATTWNAELNELEVRELNELEKRADNLTEMLLRILYNIHQKVSGPDLLQLLYRLDFNRWYSKNKPDFNLSSV
ncbi:gamma tubulin complex protein [Holotrichia oblita]|uniref:Gamma tubulin complex protein n=1 Tax=Holotrichia oblita TaxID=644536 RepID=A0ACB9TM67_HOLOL|nr:gamma tubulin complex protein [Holotrichia oblita]